MARELLAPDVDGGLGQGSVALVRTTPGTRNPDQSWLPVVPTVESETLRAVVSGALPSGQQAQEYGDGVTVLSTDLKVLAAAPAMGWRLGEGVLSLTIDGRPATIIRVRGIPEAGTAAAVEFIARH